MITNKTLAQIIEAANNQDGKTYDMLVTGFGVEMAQELLALHSEAAEKERCPLMVAETDPQQDALKEGKWA